MLSFLREQGGIDLPTRKDDVTASKTTTGDGEQPQEQYLTVADHGGRTRKSTILLAVLFIAGLLCLWFMIKKSAPSAAVAQAAETEEVKIEAALARLTGFKSELFNKMDEIVRKFYEFSDVLQVKVNELSKNPFALEIEMKSTKEESKVEKKPKIDPAMVWRQDIERKAQTLQLLSIVQSDTNTCCMIGNKILSNGDSIEGFKVHQIGEDFVKLQWEPEHDDRPDGTEEERIEIVLKLRD
jgi:hypothetical protein